MPGVRSNLRAYVVQRDNDLRALLCELLIDAGVDAIGFSEGAPAMEAARVHPPDVVVTDAFLPDISGAALARHLRQVGASDLHVIATSNADLERSFAAAFDAVLVKPFDVMQLLDAVKRAVRLRRPTI